MHPERGPQGVPLRRRQTLEAIQHRRQHLVHPGERERHLRLDSGGPRHAATRRLPGQVIEQRRLPHTRLAVHDEDPALP